MKINIKRFIQCITALLLILNTSLSIQAYSGPVNTEEETIYYATREEIEQSFESQIQDYIEQQKSIARIPEYYEYKTEFGPEKYVSASGWIGGIPAGGVYFENGGSVNIDINANPTVTVGVSFYGISISVPIGSQANGASYSCNIPAKGYYRVWNTRTEVVKSATVYGKNQYGTWVNLGVTYPHHYYRHTFVPKKV